VRGLFVTGTDTGAGKSVVAAAIVSRLAARGDRVAAFKPVITGLDDAPERWPADDELLAAVATCGQARTEVAPARFGPPVSPHYAAEQAGVEIEPHELLAAAGRAAERADTLVCEGVGGLLVPLTRGYLVRDFAVDLALPVVIAARPGLGTINHTLLTIEAARVAGLEVRAVVMTPWPPEPDGMAASNRETVAQLGRVQVEALPQTSPERLARDAEALPVDDWLPG
jgi:dethiobiotin synthetase